MEINEKVQEAIDGFKLPGELKECVVYGNGHINDTYRLTYENKEIHSAADEPQYF